MSETCSGEATDRGASIARPAAAHRTTARLHWILGAIRELSSELELDILLTKAMDVCTRMVDADRSSLFLYDRERGELWSKVAQGIDTLELRFPADKGLAGVAARTGTIVNVVDAYADERFNREFDEKTGYRTRSVLCVPMKDARGHVLGVVQVLNKADGSRFGDEDVEMLCALGSHIAVAIENAQLYESIERLFEAFVRSSSTAIDERDPVTAGHSRRVAKYALNLARAAHEAGMAAFTRPRLRQLRYASLLHDFGKIGVRESVLSKQYKISEDREALIEERMRRMALEGSLAAGAKGRGPGEMLDLIRRVNRSGFLCDDDASRIADLAAQGVLTGDEVERLSIRRGNLTPAEWQDMQSHVDRSRHILSEIPWPEELHRVPEIAHRHHEKLDGSGYPQGIAGDQIDVDARIIEVADIYDALTAQDRPYKPAMPHEKARAIMTEDARSGRLDQGLVELFFGKNLHEIELTGDTHVLAQVG